MPPFARRLVWSLTATLLLGAGLAGPGAAQPDSLDAHFEAGNRAYARGQYDRALARYRRIVEAGYASATLYYNMGNAAFRAGEVGQAIRYYETARRRRPDDPRIRHNLQQARQRAGTPAPDPRAWTRAVEGWPVGLLWLAGGLLVAAACAWSVVRVARDADAAPWRRPAVLGTVATGGLLVAVAAGASALQSEGRRAVVVAETVPLQAGPSAGARSDTTLAEGLVVRVRGRQGAWTGVRLSDGTTGWLQERSIARIE
jgi:tetratricopeptide (TPR) repeat protein